MSYEDQVEKSFVRMNSEPTKFKYDEKEFLEKALKYIDGTYNQHYAGKNDVQTIDVWDSLGSAMTTCRDTAIKYLMRHGKKDGLNEKDLLKAVHYITLLAHFSVIEKRNEMSETTMTAMPSSGQIQDATPYYGEKRR